MEIRCAQCGTANRVGRLFVESLPRCTQCSALLDVEEAGRGSGSGGWILLGAWSALCAGAVLAGHLWLQAGIQNRRVVLEQELAQLNRDAAEDAARRQKAFQAEQGELDAAHRARLADRSWLSGEGAAAARAREWERRQKRDPALAQSPAEMQLLRMEATAKNSELAAWQSMKEVAEMILPKGSRVEVIPEGNGYAVRVAFRISAMNREEAGLVTKHLTQESLRHEARQLCARVVRDFYDLCGFQPIRSLSVACNKAIYSIRVPAHATPEERAHLEAKRWVRMSVMERLVADKSLTAGVADWRRLSIADVLKHVRIDSRGIPVLEMLFNPKPEMNVPEPEGGLEF